MSAAGRSERGGGEHDFFPTPAWCVYRLLEAWSPPDVSGLWIEPGAGDGAIIRAVNQVLTPRRWHAIEIREEARPHLLEAVKRDERFGKGPGTVTIADLLSPLLFREQLGGEVACGNPAFSIAEEIIRRTRELNPVAEMAFLLRQAFLSSAERAPFYRELGTPDFLPLPDRPCFTDDGNTDNADYAWFVWPRVPRREGRIRLLATTPVEVRRPKRMRAAEMEAGQATLFGGDR